ncbi:hypothetical protein H8R20_18200 [Morganella morganii]|uniref:hypothetical protein n=1 Tax=Morganella morganii TaxID=582 RepID=UPI00164855D2|nr:hypothetical protein [Morganella morganii]MBC3997520.1 hypothetical protein [Morganella morganii]
MKIGDTFILGKYAQRISGEESYGLIPVSHDEACYVAEAWIEKERGFYSFFGTWTFPTKPTRAFVMTSGKFKILKGGVIEFAESESVKSFALVCRYLVWLVKKMPKEEKQRYFSANSVPLFMGIWLDSDLVERKTRAYPEEGKPKPVRMDYSNFAPTHQLAAIVDAGLSVGAIQFENQE